MFIGSYKFDLAAAFTDGFVHAASKLQPQAYSHKELKDFSLWLAEKFNYPRRFAWMHVRDIFSDDEAAFTKLPELYEEF